MKYRILFYYCLLLLITSCDSKENPIPNDPLTFEQSFNKVGEIIFKDIILGSIRIQKYQGGYLIMDTDRNRFEWFTVDGEHIKTIGNKGKGPGEFVKLQAFATDTSHNLFVYDAALFQFTVFDSVGNYKRSFIVKNNFRVHELQFHKGRLYAFRGYTQEGLPTYISEIDPENGEILNSFFTPPPILDKLQIPVSGYFRNMSISKNLITVVHPLLLQIHQYDLDGTLIRKIEGESSIYKKPDPDYKFPTPLHEGISATIQANFNYADTIVIGLSEMTGQGGGDYFIELYTKKGKKLNSKSINTGSKYLLYVDKQGLYYFKKAFADSSDFTTIELYELASPF